MTNVVAHFICSYGMGCVTRWAAHPGRGLSLLLLVDRTYHQTGDFQVYKKDSTLVRGAAKTEDIVDVM